MDKFKFWQLIEQSRNKSNDCEKQTAKLQKLLSKLTAEEILAFENTFTALLRETYRWDLWAVAYLINGGCSDDGFEYFRYWLIAQGQTYFEAAQETPERAADNAEAEEAECEDIRYAAREAYESKTGVSIHDFADKSDYPAEPIGEAWDEDDLETLHPTLWEKYA